MYNFHENGDTNIYTEIRSVCVRLVTQCKKERLFYFILFYTQTNNNKSRAAGALVKYIVITKMSASSRI